jgi:hypothetical protein
MKNDTILRRSKAALLAGLVALVMLCAALPASADTGDGTDPNNLTWEQNLTWESGLTWESNVTWESGDTSASTGLTWE